MKNGLYQHHLIQTVARQNTIWLHDTASTRLGQGGFTLSKKYVLTETTKQWLGITLYQIKAVRDIPEMGVDEGELGGWIEKESNLSQDGNAWVYGDAQVSGNAWVYGDAQVSGNAWVYGDDLATTKSATCNECRGRTDPLKFDTGGGERVIRSPKPFS